MTRDEASNALKPASPGDRILVVDVVRGAAVLGILLVNMLSFSGASRTATQDMGAADRLVTLGIQFLAQAKFYTMFSFLFGWGMALQMKRAQHQGADVRSFYVRRLAILLAIGLAHAILIWEGDILVHYAVLGVLLLAFRNRSSRFLLTAALVLVLIPVVVSAPGPGAIIREWQGGLVAPLRRDVVQGHQANVYVTGSYAELVVQRMKAVALGYARVLSWAPHILGMLLLGFYVGRRGILGDIDTHRPLLRRVLWAGLSLGLTLNVVFVVASDNPTLFPPAYRELAQRGARTIAGSALSVFYVVLIVLLTRRERWMARLAPLAAVGRTALSNYLLQSVACTLLFYGYGMGLYGQLGPATTVIIALLLFRAQIAVSTWWTARYRFGPAEWLWRSLAYARFQPWKPAAQPTPPAVRPVDGSVAAPRAFLTGIAWVGRRLVSICAVSFAIVFFCTSGLMLSRNSSLPVNQERRTLRDVAGPALTESLDFFQDLSSGDLGSVRPEISGRDRQRVEQVLVTAYADSARLLLVAIAVASIIGVAAGALAAARRHSALALPMLTVTVVGVSLPSFLLALLLQIGSIEFYKRTGIRVVFFGPNLGGAKSLLPRFALPALVLAARPLAHMTRVTFVALSNVLEQDYVRTARAKGLRELVIFGHHVLRNAGVRILTAVAVCLRFALGSLPVVEIFFDQPGLGVTMLNGIFQRQTNLVAGAALGLGVTFLLVNTTLDVIYRVIDPTLRSQNGGGIG